jgi:hypothetical protein
MKCATQRKLIVVLRLGNKYFTGCLLQGILIYKISGYYYYFFYSISNCNAATGKSALLLCISFPPVALPLPDAKTEHGRIGP